MIQSFYLFHFFATLSRHLVDTVFPYSSRFHDFVSLILDPVNTLDHRVSKQ